MTRQNLSSADHSNTIDRDGVCPICNQPGEHYYLERGEHWCACLHHRKKWYVGQNDGSENWRTMPPEAFAHNRQLLSGCNDVGADAAK
jgi:hypothetical protein